MGRWKRKIRLRHLISSREDAEAVKNLANGVIEKLRGTDAPLEGFHKAIKIVDEDEEIGLLVVNDAMNRLYDWADQNSVWIE